MLFGIQDSMGYSPVQLTRYWSWIRAVNQTPVFYNAAILHYPTLQEMQMLAVRYVIVPRDRRPPFRSIAVANSGKYALRIVERAAPRVRSFTNWTVVRDGASALRAVTGRGFKARRTLVLQRRPDIRPMAGGERVVRVRETSPEHLRIFGGEVGA